jgi:hypothetical protein
MLGLRIRRIEISADTNGGRFSTSIPFEDGLNIIRAENSSGKSTCINSVAYGLGLESILGPSRKRPFPKSLYEVIYENKTEETPYFVRHSSVSISIENRNGKSAILSRDILGDDNKVSVVTDSQSSDYFLGSAGNVGSAVSEKGFHNWLASFIGWHLPNVVTFEGKETKLYLECIFPLFFIEQKRGWSEIQANSPTHYGIKNVKKAAAEFCLGIDSFEYEKKLAKLKHQLEVYESDWDGIKSFSESVADFNEVKVSRLGSIDTKDLLPRIEFSYLENDVFVSVYEQEKSLKRLINKLAMDVVQKSPGDEVLNSKLAAIRVLRRQTEECSRSIEVTMLSISDAESKLATLRHDYDQYQQLKRLRSVGSDISSDLDTEKCPICESDLYDTLGNTSTKRRPMSLDENIAFLKNQLDFFTSIRDKSLRQLQDLKSEYKLVLSRMEVERESIETLRSDLEDINGAVKIILREKIQAESLLKDVQKLKETQDKLNERVSSVHSSWTTTFGSLKQIKKGKSVSNRALVIRRLEGLIKSNLEEFGFKTSAINSVTVSQQTLRPEQEGYDIVAETSASDYIRIIWSYTLSLMELAGTEDNVRHGGFVVFDEPRQHEASKVSFTNLITKAAQSSKYGGQVIFATSLDEEELRVSCKGKEVNLVCFDEYVLTLDPKTEQKEDA